MLKCQVIMETMDKIAPRDLAEEWDNPGLLIGSPAAKINKILVCLDVSEAVVKRAEQEHIDMIIAHHPFIFRSLKKIRTDLPQGKLIARLINNNTAVFAAHTNLDSALGGVNDVLAEKIGLEVEKAEETLGRTGKLAKSLTIDEFAKKVKRCLKADNIRLIRAGDRKVKKVAVCSGSGAEFIGKAAFDGADVFVTGDVKYHDAQQAVMQGIHVIDAGHFATEFPVVEALAARLREELQKCRGTVEILTDTESKDFFEIV